MKITFLPLRLSYSFDSKWNLPLLFISPYLARTIQRAIPGYCRHQHDDADIQNLAPDLLKTLGKPYRFLPSQYSTTSAIDIFGDHIVNFSDLTLKNITDDVYSSQNQITHSFILKSFIYGMVKDL